MNLAPPDPWTATADGVRHAAYAMTGRIGRLR
jgi:hypothetical protein